MTADEQYSRQKIADLKRSASVAAKEQRASIDARIAELQIYADAAKTKLAKLEKAGDQSWAALRDGLNDTNKAFDKAEEAVRAAFEQAEK